MLDRDLSHYCQTHWIINHQSRLSFFKKKQQNKSKRPTARGPQPASKQSTMKMARDTRKCTLLMKAFNATAARTKSSALVVRVSSCLYSRNARTFSSGFDGSFKNEGRDGDDEPEENLSDDRIRNRPTLTWRVSSDPNPASLRAHEQYTLGDSRTVLRSQRAAALPRNIFLLRHGESLGNQDESLYSTTPDWKIPLSERGQRQARAAGRRIQALMKEDGADAENAPVLYYVSPYLRTKQTLQHLNIPNTVLYTREEPRLREQDFGNFQIASEIRRSKRERPKFGRFFYRFPNGGESGADVFDRVSAFTGTFLRDMEQLDAATARRATAIFVTHGITARLFVMKWFHWSVDEFEELHNPPNCGLLHLRRIDYGDGYQLTEQSRRLIKGPVPSDSSGVGQGLRLGKSLLLHQARRMQGLTWEDRQAFDSLPTAARGL